MEIKLSKWQTIVWDDPSRIKVINVGRRSGKTTLSILKTIDFASSHPNTISWIISPTYRQTKQICFELLKTYLPIGLIDKVNETELVFKLKNGSHIYLKGADSPDSLRGVRIDFCIFDETAFIDRWDEVWKVVRPTLVDSKAECWFISTPDGFNHFWKLFNNPEFKHFHFTSYDNPFLEKDELDRVRIEMDEDSFAQEFLGEFRKMSGLVYKSFNRNIHMVDIPQLDTNWTYTRTLDFGFAHKTALCYFAINTVENAIYVYDGVYKSDLVTEELAEAIKTRDMGKIITNPVADSAQPILIEELRRLGVHFNPVEKGPDSVKNGIVKVAELLKVRNDTGKPTIMFNKNLTWIADEFERYHWMENKSSDNLVKEVPYKAFDDFLDALRYFAMTFRKKEARDFTDPNLEDNEGW